MEHTYPFTEGYSGRGIKDGGSDMYDGGNYISVHGKTEDGTPRWEFELPYTQDCQGLFPAPTGIGDITYATCKLMDGAPHPHPNPNPNQARHTSWTAKAT